MAAGGNEAVTTGAGTEEWKKVPGLLLLEEFISEEEASQLLAQLDSLPWGGRGVEPNPELRRRTQQFGYQFSFRTRTIEKDLGPLPPFLDGVVQRMQSCGIFPEAPPDLLLVNEYDRGQGIMPHVDAPSFGPTVTSLSLCSPCIMTFTKVDSGDATHVILQPRSLLVLRDDARYKYKHGISKEDVEMHNGHTIERGRRVSLTFRTKT
ncbi:hypothetical protein PhCBS80983_g01381 [Powellomyces hirtus]|uniref:Fe2OG dioxygenase domain-containing protein n=1 Tax=Powellomyces hirtus TaxID=109895 RepID=A0A507EDD2_9FUNG|nr:hypothetical protein PhCBS80983_g01381 [Powellomyces hirtus]